MGALSLAFAATMALAGIMSVYASADDGAKPVRVSPSTALPAQPQTTYFDLLHQIVPSLSLAGEVAKGRLQSPLRTIADPLPPVDAPDLVEFRELLALTFTAEGKSRLAVLADMTRVDDAEQRTLLAVFDDSRPPRLLDAVDVGMDRATAFAEPPLVQIGARDRALVTSSRHSNSNQSYALDAVIFLHEGKLTLIDTFLVFGERGCGFTQIQSIAFKNRRPVKLSRYDDLEVTIREQRKAAREVCDDASSKKLFTRATSTIYRWSPTSQRFVPSSDALKRLAEKTTERF